MTRARTIADFGDGIATADIGDGQVTEGKLNSTLDLSGKTMTLPSGVGGKFVSYAVCRDEKAAGTNGGTFTAGAHQVRDLAVKHFDPDGIVSLSNNRFSLGAGTYFIRWSCPAFDVGQHATRLYNFTDSSDIEEGSAEFAPNTDDTQTRSFGSARVTIAGTKEFEILHRCGTTKSANGFGVQPGANATIAVYTIVEIFKEA